MIAYEHIQLDALGDGTRRAILARLLTDGPLAVTDIAQAFDVSRPAISQHLAILKAAHLVADERQGTRRVYELDPRGFRALRAFFDSFWADALFAFKMKVEESRPHRHHRSTRARKP